MVPCPCSKESSTDRWELWHEMGIRDHVKEPLEVELDPVTGSGTVTMLD